jgi:primosomal protein N' (replication factor Y)
MSSAARSSSGAGQAPSAGPGRGRPVLSGPVAVCVDRPVLSLDRAFTYDLPGEMGAGVGSLVQVPFHGRLVQGWVLGRTDDVPARILRARRLVSPVRFFDDAMLGVLRWVSERYVAPLASVIARSHPPRVASEEAAVGASGVGGGRVGIGMAAGAHPAGPLALAWYDHGREMLAAIAGGAGAFVLRPAPEDEVTAAVECVGACLTAARTAIVLVPDANPVPATAAAIRDAFGDAVALLLGGDKRERYRRWLEILAGRYACVIGTRAAVFAPLPDLGLILVSRESHAMHREERSPYYHVRDVALVRAARVGGVCAMSALCPSLETTAVAHTAVEPAERRWAAVEVVRPGPEGRAPRLLSALKSARRGFLFAPLPGYGVARICRGCGEPAACASCGGLLRAEEGQVRCAVCGADGRCASCGASDFGIARGGAERVEEWAGGVAQVQVRRIGAREVPRPVGGGEILVGGIDAVKDFGPLELDLVGILDADLAARRPGLAARERALVSWMEAAAWARPNGRVIVQTAHPNDPAVQALVSGRPERFHRAELPRLADAGFPVGAAVFRVAGRGELEAELRALRPRTLLTTSLEGETLCLVAVDPGGVAPFGRVVRGLAERGVVTRVEAEPHL